MIAIEADSVAVAGLEYVVVVVVVDVNDECVKHLEKAQGFELEAIDYEHQSDCCLSLKALFRK